MRKTLLAMLALLAAPLFADDYLIARDFNLDGTTYVYPTLCTLTGGSAAGQCPGSGYDVQRKITTSGASSATVTAVSSNAAFDLVAVGDMILISPDGAEVTTPALRRVTAKASSNSITVDSVITIAAAGANWRLWTLTAGTGAAGDGWFRMDARAATIQVQIDQMSVTGGIDYSLECGMSPLGTSTPLTSDSVATANIASASTVTLVVAEPYDLCRLGLKIGTNDNLDTVTNGVNDSLDFVEDPDGTPVACVADVAAGTYTGAGLATAIAAAMNTAGICAGATDPTDTYTATFNEFTGTYTITTSGTPTYATFDLPWNTGANAGTSIDTLIGFSADVADAGTYTGSAVTHDIGAEAEKITVTVARR